MALEPLRSALAERAAVAARLVRIDALDAEGALRVAIKELYVEAKQMPGTLEGEAVAMVEAVADLRETTRTDYALHQDQGVEKVGRQAERLMLMIFGLEPRLIKELIGDDDRPF